MTELKITTLEKEAILVTGELQAESIIDEHSPALSVMTDFRTIDAIVVKHSASLSEAHSLMLKRAVRLLFVMKFGEFIGVITVRDILGERPLLLKKPHDSITVEEIMTKKEELLSLSYGLLEKSKIGDLLKAVKKINRRHIMITDDSKGGQKIVGMISTSTMAQKMGKTLNTGLPTDLLR